MNDQTFEAALRRSQKRRLQFAGGGVGVLVLAVTALLVAGSRPSAAPAPDHRAERVAAVNAHRAALAARPAPQAARPEPASAVAAKPVPAVAAKPVPVADTKAAPVAKRPPGKKVARAPAAESDLKRPMFVAEPATTQPPKGSAVVARSSGRDDEPADP